MNYHQLKTIIFHGRQWATISAHTNQHNPVQHKNLKLDLIGMFGKHNVVPCLGCYKGGTEKSYFVSTPHTTTNFKNSIVWLGKKYRQEEVIVKDNSSFFANMYECDTGNLSLAFNGYAFGQRLARKQDGWTAFKKCTFACVA